MITLLHMLSLFGEDGFNKILIFLSSFGLDLNTGRINSLTAEETWYPHLASKVDDVLLIT